VACVAVACGLGVLAAKVAPRAGYPGDGCGTRQGVGGALWCRGSRKGCPL